VRVGELCIWSGLLERGAARPSQCLGEHHSRMQPLLNFLNPAYSSSSYVFFGPGLDGCALLYVGDVW